MKTPVEVNARPAMIAGSGPSRVSSAPAAPIAIAAPSPARWPCLSIHRPPNGVTITPSRYTTKSQPSAAVLRLYGGAARWNVTYVNIATFVNSTQNPSA
ncbi:MAG: hypothetical protein DMG02_12025 [Acidobacteria bacterium]|nr:MAG: hypothetical protein DMG02_12025 [Acidobacteriota bacterium]PYR10604.1 MAG: hypothetical protein DMF99_10990 [Acidobacteriota bacterium]